MNQETAKTTIISHPGYEALKHYCELLRERLLRLILEKDELLNTIIPNIEAEYQLSIGYLMYEKFCLQTEINKSKRIIEIIQTAVNRGDTLSVDSMETMLAMEFREWEERLKEQLLSIETARAIEKSRLSLKESRKITDLYRKLVKKLHPDVNPELYASNKALWDQAQEAYIRSDRESLEALWLIAQDIAETSSAVLTSMEQLQQKETALRKSIGETKKLIEAITSLHPYNLKDQLADRSWVEGEQNSLKKEISDLSVEKSRFRIMADQMTRRYCHE